MNGSKGELNIADCNNLWEELAFSFLTGPFSKPPLGLLAISERGLKCHNCNNCLLVGTPKICGLFASQDMKLRAKRNSPWAGWDVWGLKRISFLASLSSLAPHIVSHSAWHCLVLGKYLLIGSKGSQLHSSPTRLPQDNHWNRREVWEFQENQ